MSGEGAGGVVVVGDGADVGAVDGPVVVEVGVGVVALQADRRAPVVRDEADVPAVDDAVVVDVFVQALRRHAVGRVGDALLDVAGLVGHGDTVRSHFIQSRVVCHSDSLPYFHCRFFHC